jgi:hypothetical protein
MGTHGHASAGCGPQNKLFSSASFLLVLAVCISSLVAQTPFSSPLVVFQTSGGFAGVDEVLTVFKDGKIEFADNKRNQHSEARVKPEQIEKLRKLISSPKYQQLQSPPMPRRGADYFSYRVTTWADDGKEHTITATDLNLPAILSHVISELNALRNLIVITKPVPGGSSQ